VAYALDHRHVVRDKQKRDAHLPLQIEQRVVANTASDTKLIHFLRPATKKKAKIGLRETLPRRFL
jgi:hypothetical protein